MTGVGFEPTNIGFADRAINRSGTRSVVLRVGLEPARPYGQQSLSLPGLPVPPPEQVCGAVWIRTACLVVGTIWGKTLCKTPHSVSPCVVHDRHRGRLPARLRHLGPVFLHLPCPPSGAPSPTTRGTATRPVRHIPAVAPNSTPMELPNGLSASPTAVARHGRLSLRGSGLGDANPAPFSLFSLVHQAGLEPAPGFPDQVLNLACLPIPPLMQSVSPVGLEPTTSCLRDRSSTS